MRNATQLSKKLRKFFCSRRVPGQDVGDLAQETILRVLRRSRKESLDSTEAFAIGVSRHVLSEYWRRAKKARFHQDISGAVGLAGHSDPLTDALRRERGSLVRQALARLPERTRRLLVKRFMEKVPRRTIASTEGVCVGTIDVRVCRARRELTKLIRKELHE
jgi:RNA polymerase sigma factor (sigma-70 family)